MSKVVQNLVVVGNRRLNAQIYVLDVQLSSGEFPVILPGQFAEVLVENSSKVFLRRPISIHDVDVENKIISLYIRIVGEGTKVLADLPMGAQLNLVYPLGNSFSMPSSSNVLMIGGGSGVAPFLYLAKYIYQRYKKKPFLLLGARSASDIVLREEFEKYAELLITTNDGSLGEAGFVTSHSIWQNLHVERIYTCGPEVMMKAIGKLAQEKQIPCEVSLENTMACGVGACLCCVQKTTSGHKCVCTDGPIFNVNEVIW